MQYGPADGNRHHAKPGRYTGIESGTGQNANAESRVRKSPAGLTSVIASSLPSTRTPEMWAALRARYAATPSMSDARLGPAEYTFFGESERSRLCRKVSAVTAWPDGGEKR